MKTNPVVALALATRILASGHSVAAAQWAIHHSIQAGRLRAGLVEVGLPSFGTPVWGYDGRLAWSGGGTGTIRLPEGQQAPFDACKVIATPALWEWWRTWTEQQQPDGNDLNWKPINNVQPPLAGAEEVSPGSGEAVNEPVREPAIGFLGGIELANALGVHPTRRAAFSRQLDRHRASLGDDIWHEVSNPRPNSPRYLYRMDSASLRALAASYHEERPA